MSVTTEMSLSPACWMRITDDAMQAAGLQTGTLVKLEPPTEFVEPGQAAAITLACGRSLIRFVDSITADTITVRAAIIDSKPETYARGDVIQLSRVSLARTILA